MIIKNVEGQPIPKAEKEVVQHYISVAAHKIRVLISKVEEISRQDYRTSSPLALSEILIRILSRFFNELRSLAKKIDHQLPSDVLKKVYIINYIIVNIIPELIEAVDEADVNQSIASIIEAYEQIGGNVRYGTQTIIHSTWEYNASFIEIMQTLRSMTNNLGQETNNAIFSGAPPYFLIITYPKAEEQIILRQALIAHEMAHFIDQVKNWSGSLFDQQLFDPEDHELITKAVQNYKSKNPRMPHYDAIQILEEMIVPWVDEIVADCLAVAIIGPAYLFAFDEVSFSPKYTSPSKLSLTHPPDQLRKAIMAGLILESQFSAAEKSREFRGLERNERELFASVKEWINTISPSDAIGYKSIADYGELPEEIVSVVFLILKKALEKAVNILRADQLKSIENEQWVCGGADIIDAIRLQELLAHGLTATELYESTGRDPTFAAIMNSGWFHFLNNKHEYRYFSETGSSTGAPESVVNKYIILQNLIAKSVESLHFKKQYSQRKGAGG